MSDKRPAVHTKPSPTGKGWWNEWNGTVLSRHRLKDPAVEAGIAIARQLGVDQIVYRNDGSIQGIKVHKAA
jgi:hypothetical protein